MNSPDVPFRSEKRKPGDLSLAAALGEMHACYEDLLEACAGFRREWKYYKASGWILKVFDRKKALFWLVPLRGGFRLSFALREAERDDLLKARMAAGWRRDLREAKKYPEGYAFRIDVKSKTAYAAARRIVRAVRGHRV